MSKCSENQVLFAEFKALAGKTWDSKLWDGDIWMDAFEGAGTAEPPEPSELAEQTLSFLVRRRTSAVLEDAVEVSPPHGNRCVLEELCQFPPLVARLITRVKSQHHPREGVLKRGNRTH